MQGVHKAAIAGVVLALAGAAPGAWAAGNGWYLRFAGAYTRVGDAGWTSQQGPVTTKSKQGYGAEIAFGDDLGRVWSGGAIRGEFAVLWQQNDVDKHYLGGVALVNPTGHVRVQALMYNLINDFLPTSTFDPYLGVGIGYAGVHFAYSGTAAGGSAWVNSSDDVFAYQFLAGFKLQFSPTVALDFGYSWFRTSEPSFTVVGIGQTKSSYRAGRATLGIDWTF